MFNGLIACTSDATTRFRNIAALRMTTIRSAITFIIIASLIVSSPIFMLVNPAQAVTTTDGRSSDYHSIPRLVETDSSQTNTGPTALSLDGGGNEFTTQAALSSVTVKPSNNIVNTRAFYDITFTTSSSGSIHKIIIDFPTGTGIGVDNLLVDTSGIGPGTAAKTGPLQITYTVANPTLIPPGRTIKLELSTIENPPNPGPSKEIMVTTKRPAGTTIDGPTQSADYRIKQIGTTDIADGAITGGKMAGTTKLIFGTCTGSLPAIPAGGNGQINCSDSNAQFGDEIVFSWSNSAIVPAPLLRNLAISDGSITFGFGNPSSVETAAQGTVQINYIIYNIQ
jgi:hypothetical protein